MFIVNQKLGKLLRFLELEKNYFSEPFLKDLRKLAMTNFLLSNRKEH